MIHTFIRLAVLVPASLAVGCASTGRPEVRTVNAHVSGIDFSGVNVVFNVDVYNPYTVRIKSPMVRYGIDVAETEFMQSEQTTQVDLLAGGVGTIPLPVRMEYAKLWEAHAKLKDAGEIPYRLHGEIIVTNLDFPWEVPLEYKGKLPMLRPPFFSSPRVKIADVSLTGARVALEVKVHNPNVCSLGLANVGYSLALGGVPVGNVRASVGELAARSTGTLSLTGEVTAAGALMQLIRGESLGLPSMGWSGIVQTPYGSVPLRPGVLSVNP